MSGTPQNNSQPPGHRQPPEIDPPLADDQRWFAYELHDGLLQWIVGARMLAQAALATAAETDSISIEKHREIIARIKVLLDKAAEEGRSLIRFVDRPTDEAVDIGTQLQQFCDLAISRSQSVNAPTIELIQEGPRWPTLSIRRAWSVLRILQQAIQNAIAHSQADRIEVQLGWSDPQTLSARVIDQGIGFDSTAKFPNHFGLSTMKHRAAMCRGKLEIVTAPGQGCQVHLTLPL